MLTVYSTSFCPYCTRAKTLLESLGVAYEERDLTGDSEALQALVARSGMMTVPQIFDGDELVGGYSELAAAVADGRFA